MEDSAHQWLKHQSPQNHPVYLYLHPRASINTSPKLQPDQSLLSLFWDPEWARVCPLWACHMRVFQNLSRRWSPPSVWAASIRAGPVLD